MRGWKPDEQFLLRSMKDPNMVQHYHCAKAKFYRQAAVLMDGVNYKQIGRKVENMVKSLKKHFDADEPVFAPLLLILYPSPARSLHFFC